MSETEIIQKQIANISIDPKQTIMAARMDSERIVDSHAKVIRDGVVRVHNLYERLIANAGGNSRDLRGVKNEFGKIDDADLKNDERIDEITTILALQDDKKDPGYHDITWKQISMKNDLKMDFIEKYFSHIVWETFFLYNSYNPKYDRFLKQLYKTLEIKGQEMGTDNLHLIYVDLEKGSNKKDLKSWRQERRKYDQSNQKVACIQPGELPIHLGWGVFEYISDRYF